MELNNILKFEEKYGDVALSFSREETNELKFTNGKISNASHGESSLLEVRISKGKKFGYALTRNIKDWKNTVLSAAKLMRVSRELDFNVPLATKEKVKKVEGVFYEDVKKIPFPKLFDYGDELLSNVDESFNIPKAEVSNAYDENIFLNSNGVLLRTKGTSFSSSIEVSNGKLNSYEYHTSHDLHKTSKIGKKASELLKMKLHSKRIPSFKGDVFLDHFAVSDLFESVVIPAVLADNIQSRKSNFANKLNKKVFSDVLTVVDNGVLFKGLFSSPFDGEGKPTTKTTIVENGFLKGFLYDMYSAKKDGVKSTGNSTGISKLPNIGSTNFMIKKGAFSREEMYSEIKKGIYIREIFGSHLINNITGDCSVGAEDVFYIKNGELIHPVKQAMISFNLFDALKRVTTIGKDYRQESHVVAVPMIFKNVQVVS